MLCSSGVDTTDFIYFKSWGAASEIFLNNWVSLFLLAIWSLMAYDKEPMINSLISLSVVLGCNLVGPAQISLSCLPSDLAQKWLPAIT